MAPFQNSGFTPHAFSFRLETILTSRVWPKPQPESDLASVLTADPHARTGIALRFRSERKRSGKRQSSRDLETPTELHPYTQPRALSLKERDPFLLTCLASRGPWVVCAHVPPPTKDKAGAS